MRDTDTSITPTCLSSNSAVFAYKGILVVDTLTIAREWNMHHKNVLRACSQAQEHLASVGQVNALKLIPIEYIDSKGRSQQKLLLDETAFFTVAGGFQGAVSTAMRFKIHSDFKKLKEQIVLTKKRGKKPRMLHTAVFNTNSLFADFDKAIGLVELRKMPESEMTGWQKVFSRAYYCTRNYSRMKLKVDTELMPALRTTLIDVFGKPVTDNLIDLVERRKLKTSQPSTQR
jgi:Rha family phage regulatory protein